MRFFRTKIFGIARHLFRGMGARMHQLGLLHDPAHIFYLKVDEIRGFIEGRSLGEDYAELARKRFFYSRYPCSG